MQITRVKTGDGFTAKEPVYVVNETEMLEINKQLAELEFLLSKTNKVTQPK